MPRDYRLYLEDILEAISSVEHYTNGIDVVAFSADTMRCVLMQWCAISDHRRGGQTYPASAT